MKSTSSSKISQQSFLVAKIALGASAFNGEKVFDSRIYGQMLLIDAFKKSLMAKEFAVSRCTTMFLQCHATKKKKEKTSNTVNLLLSLNLMREV